MVLQTQFLEELSYTAPSHLVVHFAHQLKVYPKYVSIMAQTTDAVSFLKSGIDYVAEVVAWLELLLKDGYRKYLHDESEIGRWRQPEMSDLTMGLDRTSDAGAH